MKDRRTRGLGERQKEKLWKGRPGVRTVPTSSLAVPQPLSNTLSDLSLQSPGIHGALYMAALVLEKP